MKKPTILLTLEIDMGEIAEMENFKEDKFQKALEKKLISVLSFIAPNREIVSTRTMTGRPSLFGVVATATEGFRPSICAGCMIFPKVSPRKDAGRVIND